MQSETLRLGKMECIVSVDCLDEGFLKEKAWGQSVSMMSGFDEVAAERCRKLQHVARRLAARRGA